MNRISHRIELDAPVGRVFDFYAEPRNVIRMAPPELHLKLVRADSPLRQGSRVHFSIRPRLVPFELLWLMEVKEFVPNRLFVDRAVRAPFGHWEHRHEFEALSPERTLIVDSIEFGSPNGIVDRLVGTTFVRNKVREMFVRWERILRREVVGAGHGGEGRTAR